MREVNLLESFPKPKRNVESMIRTDLNRVIAKRYDQEFFDGERINGYGGYYYDGRWKGVVNTLKSLYDINQNSSVLDIGCAKGFLLYDLEEMIPGIKVAGMDISSYAINHAMDGFGKYCFKKGFCAEDSISGIELKAKQTILPRMIIGSAESLPWPDKSFDVVLSINTLHNLPNNKIKTAIQEMNRVCRNKNQVYIQVDSYRSDEEKAKMKNWVLTAETVLNVEGWKDYFKECGFAGDYYWTIV